VEKRGGKRRYFWWKVFTAQLAPGAHKLIVEPSASKGKAGSIRLDAVFLSTAPEYASLYPYGGDFNFPSGTYLRFSIGSLPQGGSLRISARMQIHESPFHLRGIEMARNGLFDRKTEGNPEPHRESGYTRWYRLQDAAHVPSKGNVGLRLRLSERDGVTGRTEFAAAPHRDRILRSFDWGAVDGLRISMDMRLGENLHKLRTFRDHERQHYRWALSATDERLLPLTRGDLIFANGSGRATGGAEDYMFKVFRLLGFNAAATRKPRLYHKLYGAQAQGGHYRPPRVLPYEPDRTRQRFNKHYQKYWSRLSKGT
jgi:hypothetical protein